ncbi:MAG: tRNA lysidine(34) synthetase TilS [Ligilactobacillus sp.]|nr:tRNA lysidine(34) synthetase TilS [Ligilactobacillus sp.]
MEKQFQKNWPSKLARVPILVAVSTGCDSMVLLDLLLQLPAQLRPKIQVVYIDHQLRAQSQVEGDFLRKYCQVHQLPLFEKAWPVAAHPQTGLEAAARKFRYDFFAEVMMQTKTRYLLTAHHGDDQVETILMKLLRGGKLAQLLGMATWRNFRKQGQIYRPLLAFSKAELYAYAHRKRLTYFEDETNAQDDYLRNRLRHQVVPALKAENPRLLGQVASYREQLSQTLTTVAYFGQRYLKDIQTESGYDLNRWQNLPRPVQAQLWDLLLAQIKYDQNTKQTRQVLELLNNPYRPNGEVQLSPKLYLFKRAPNFWIGEKSVTASFTPQPLKLNQWQTLPDGRHIGLVRAEDASIEAASDYLELTALPRGGLYVRTRQAGDKLVTRAGHQKVKKILIDQKLSPEARAKQLLVTDRAQNVYWILDLKKSDLSRGQTNAKIQYIVVLF